jgi:hypothetical protein
MDSIVSIIEPRTNAVARFVGEWPDRFFLANSEVWGVFDSQLAHITKGAFSERLSFYSAAELTVYDVDVNSSGNLVVAFRAVSQRGVARELLATLRCGF